MDAGKIRQQRRRVFGTGLSGFLGRFSVPEREAEELRTARGIKGTFFYGQNRLFAY